MSLSLLRALRGFSAVADVFTQDFINAAPTRKLFIDDPMIMLMVQRGGPAILARLAGAYRAGVLDFPGGTVPQILNNYMTNGRFTPYGPTAANNDPRVTVALTSLNTPSQLDTQVQSILGRNLPGYMAQALQAQGFTGHLYLDDNIFKAYQAKYGEQGLFRLRELERGGFITNNSNAFQQYLRTGTLPDMAGIAAAAPQDLRVNVFSQPASGIYNYAAELARSGYPGYGGFTNPTVGGYPPSTVTGGTDEDNAFTQLKEYLENLGFPNIEQFARDFIRSGKPMDLLEMELRQTPQFAERFPAIIALEKLKDQNPQANIVIPTPQEYVDYERQAASLLASAGLWNLATRENVSRWLQNQRSIVELGTIIQEGYEAVAHSPQEVRDAFAEYYGPSGDAALASYFLNTNATAEQIKGDVATANIGGAARLNQIGIGRNLSERVSDLGISFSEALQGFGNLRAKERLLGGTISQQAFDPNRAIEAQFGMNPTAVNELQRRLGARVAAFSGGGAAASSGRTVALGTAL